MQYAASRFVLPSRRSIVAPLVALVVGAGAAVGGYALIDNQDAVQVQAPGEVVFIDTPGPGEGVRGIDDTANAATASSQPKVIPYLSQGAGADAGSTGSTKDEASTAAAIGSGANAQDGDRANRTDPHGPAAFLHR